MVSRLWFLYNDNRNVVLEQKMQKGGTMISKKLFMTLGLSCLLLVGCQTAHKTMPESSTLTSTGYASKEVQLISLFYDGALYLYNATGFDLPKEKSWEFLGQIAFVNNLEFPTEDFCGTHLNVGQEVYRDPKIPQKLYVKYDSGFALFEVEETKKEESTEYLDYVTAGIKLWTSDSLELKLTNVSNETISYGEAFTMEVLHDGIWEKLPVLLEDYGFNDISYELEPGEYSFIDIDFAWLYGELHEGWFRIIKEIYLQDGTVYSVPAEFGDLDLRQTEIVNYK
ncbi:immunoglobulin-like domain-containing protein [[Clostridium] symbiosum]|uniref:immunoglobulin-like domain-containing protein n=1 Tax=Clostridium symbiosum TaxID=1512 RepID=UPI0034A35141